MYHGTELCIEIKEEKEQGVRIIMKSGDIWIYSQHYIQSHSYIFWIVHNLNLVQYVLGNV